MTLKVKSEEYHDGVGLTWDDTGLPLSKREGQAWWAGWDEGRKDGEIDTREEMADEIERLRATLNQTRRFALSGEMDTLVSDEIERMRAFIREVACGEGTCGCAMRGESNDECLHGRARTALGEKK